MWSYQHQTLDPKASGASSSSRVGPVVFHNPESSNFSLSNFSSVSTAHQFLCVLAQCYLPQKRHHMKIAKVIHAVELELASHSQPGTLSHTVQPSWSSESPVRESEGRPRASQPHKARRDVRKGLDPKCKKTLVKKHSTKIAISEKGRIQVRLKNNSSLYYPWDCYCYPQSFLLLF